MAKSKAAERAAVKAHDAPLSETIIPKVKDGSAEDVLEDLRAMAKAEPHKVISRNYYRVHGRFAESVWNMHFGTFHEFKRQAGIVLSRHAHNLEKKIAIHASRDHYRAMSLERMGYADKYLRPASGKFRTVLVASDLHDIEIDPFFLRVFIDTAKRVNPDVLCLNGDVFDLPEFGKYNVDPREWDVVGRIKFVHEKILGPIREACPDMQIDLIEGNHERRLLLHLADATPALRAVLSDLHGWTVPKLLGLDKYQVNYIAKGDLAAVNKKEMAEELEKSYKVYWDCFLAHHFPHARDMGLPGWNGHHHRHHIWEMFNRIYGTYEWHQLGAGHRRDATYCEGERWANGLLIANCNVETKSTCMDYAQITDFAVIGGKFYERTVEEGAGKPAVWPGK